MNTDDEIKAAYLDGFEDGMNEQNAAEYGSSSILTAEQCYCEWLQRKHETTNP